MPSSALALGGARTRWMVLRITSLDPGHGHLSDANAYYSASKLYKLTSHHEVACVDYERAFDWRSTLQASPTSQLYCGMHNDFDMSCSDYTDLELPGMVGVLDLKTTRIVL